MRAFLFSMVRKFTSRRALAVATLMGLLLIPRLARSWPCDVIVSTDETNSYTVCFGQTITNTLHGNTAGTPYPNDECPTAWSVGWGVTFGPNSGGVTSFDPVNQPNTVFTFRPTHIGTNIVMPGMGLTFTDCMNHQLCQNSGSITLTVVVPSPIANQPVSQAVCSGGSAIFSVGASGSALSYQWYKNGAILTNGGTLSGVTLSSLTLSSLATNDTGKPYTVFVSNSCAWVLSSAATLTVGSIVPSIASQPTSFVACSGQSASFTVGTSGDSVNYQWFKNGTLVSNGGSVSGATSSTLTLTGVSANDDHTSYNVVIANGCGTQTSTTATLGFSTPCDGIPDWWRQQYFGSGTTTNGTTCATCDYDGDGVKNLTEFVQGRDPTKGASSDTNGVVNLQVFTPLE